LGTTSALPSLSDSLGSSGSATTGTGLGAGINVQQFVQFALANQTAAITALQTQQTGLGSQNGELATITSQLSSLSDAVAALNDPLGALNSEIATSSNSSILNASASGGATPGAHTISIANLATTSSFYTDAVASSSAPLATGDTIAISVGGTPATSITIDSTNNTLDQLAASINSKTSAVRASVINDANGARIALVSATSGNPGSISVTGSLHLPGVANTAVAFHQASAGLNASLTVDGVPVSSTGNTVSGVINGVTLNLTAPTLVGSTDTPVSLTVAPDSTQATNAINAFVNAYNTVVKEINTQFKVNSDGTGGGVLENDSSLREAQSAILAAVSNSVTGNSGIVNLASLGINLQDDGTLTVDNGALSTALASNFAAVQNLFQNANASFTNHFSNVITSLTSPASGVLTLDAQSIQSTSQSVARQLSTLQAALVEQGTNLTAVYSRVNATLQQLPLLQNQITQQLAAVRG
jgi:flagellar hook-associated protein 2